MARRFMEIVLVIVAAVTLIIAVLALIVTYLTARFPQAVAEAIRLPTPLPEKIEVTVVATPTPGPTQTPVIESVEQMVTRIVEVTRVVPVEVTRVVIVTATPTATPTVNPAVAALEEDFMQLDTSTWDVVSGDWATNSGQLSLPYDEDVPAQGVMFAGFDTWDNYSVEMNVSGLYDYPIGDDQTIGQTCYFAVPSSQEGYTSDFMNGTPKAFDSDGNPRSRFACRPGNWISRAALLVGADRTGPIAGLIIGENYMGWGSFSGNSWRTDPAKFIRAPGASGASLRVDVSGIEYTVYINGQRRPELDYTDGGRSGGRIGIWVRNAAAQYDDFVRSDDDWRLTPKVEDIRVTPLVGAN